MKTLFAAIITLALVSGSALAGEQTCCEKAKAERKECRHKCCIAAHAEGKSCTKCNPNKEDLKKDEKKAAAPKKKAA